ncbi:MAG: hypothetical protein IJ571_07345 [Ruminococcus sp.]|nr:hypothetical protein [Ruminococcus sp.]
MKKKNSAKRRLLSAAGMLAISAAMLSSATFAWFSLNKDVSATITRVRVQSENPYLLINEEEDETNTTYTTSADLMTAQEAAAQLKLVKPSTIAADASMVWQEAVAAAPDAATKNSDPYTTLTLAASDDNEHILGANTGVNDAFAGYVLSYDLYFKTANDTNATNLRLAEQTANPAGVVINSSDFTVGDTATDEIENAARVLFVNQATGVYYLYDVGAGSGTYGGGSGTPTALAETVTKENGSVHLKVYMYFDGDDVAAYTNNAVDLDDVTASFNFVVD